MLVWVDVRGESSLEKPGSEDMLHDGSPGGRATTQLQDQATIGLDSPISARSGGDDNAGASGFPSLNGWVKPMAFIRFHLSVDTWEGTSSVISTPRGCFRTERASTGILTVNPGLAPDSTSTPVGCVAG